MLFEPRRWLFSCSLSLLLGACGESGGARQLAAPAAARVDGEEISLQQVNAVLARIQDKTSIDGAGRARKEVLERLIDQQVLYTQGLSQQVDRDPKVAGLIDAARREIVARAYMDTLLAAPANITAEDMHQYYVENPALFSKRRIYTLHEINLPANRAVQGALQRMAEEGRSTADIRRYLAAKGIEYVSVSGVRTAEQIPMDVLPRLASVRDGDTGFIESGARYYIFYVASSQSAPIAEREARQHIEVFLGNQQRQRIVAQEVKRLKASASIEYLGEFAKTVDAGTATQASTASTAATVAALKTERTTR